MVFHNLQGLKSLSYTYQILSFCVDGLKYIFASRLNMICTCCFTGTHFQEGKSRCQMALVSLSAVTASSWPMRTLWPTRGASVWSSPTETCTMPLCKMLIQLQTSPPSKSRRGWEAGLKQNLFIFLSSWMQVLLYVHIVHEYRCP